MEENQPTGLILYMCAGVWHLGLKGYKGCLREEKDCILCLWGYWVAGLDEPQYMVVSMYMLLQWLNL